MHIIGQITMWAVLQLCREVSGITGWENLCGVARRMYKNQIRYCVNAHDWSNNDVSSFAVT